MQTFSFLHVAVKPGEQIGFHEHPQWELSYVVRGQGRRTLGLQQVDFVQGEVLIIPPDLPHGWTFDRKDEQIESITVLFSSEMLDGLSFLPELAPAVHWLLSLPGPISFTGGTLVRLQTRLLRMEEESEEERLITFLSMLVLIYRTQEKRELTTVRSGAEDRLKKIETYIACNYNHDITIDDIAKHIGMNRSSLCTFYRHQTGRTLVEALNARRLEVALNLLRHRNLPVQQVCFDSGFRDVPYFCRFFKKQTGMTPRQYRNTLPGSSSPQLA